MAWSALLLPALATWGLESVYSGKVVSFLEKPPPLDAREGIGVQALSTEGNPTYMGFFQSVRIEAPLAKTLGTVLDFESYPETLVDVVSTSFKKLENGRYEVLLEQRIPLPFVPNERNVMIYEVVRSSDDSALIRYQLKSSKYLRFYDGAILLSARGKSQTEYLAVDFWDADWGLAKAFGTDRLWRSNLEGLLQADLAVKLKAENPAWPNAKVKDESRKLAASLPIKDWVKRRSAAR